MKNRHLVLIALLAAAGWVAGPAATPARAGLYPVEACMSGSGDVNHAWVPESNNPKMTAYANCPVPSSETRVWNEGLVTRASVPSGGGTESVGGYSYAALRLRAPPGAELMSITFAHTLCGWNGFKAGLIDAANHWLLSTGPDDCGTFIPSPWTIDLHGTPSIALMTICAKASCKLSAPLGAWASMRWAAVWVSDSTRPSVAIAARGIAAAGWHGGIQPLVVSAHDNVGIRHVDVYLDGQLARDRAGACDWTAVVPCATSLSGLYVDSHLVRDGVHTLGVVARDSAGNTSSTSRRVLIDNTAPTGPVALHEVGGETWRAANRFDVAWTNPSQVGTAPIAAVRYAVCPATNALDDFTGCASGSGPGAGLAQGIRVPGPGDWIGRFWLQDSAGNQDRRTAQPVHLRYDDAPPVIRFLAADPNDPQQIRVSASDGLSGVASVEVEIRREGHPAWISLPVLRGADDVFTARVDDAALPAGRYEIRARARDGAGNERSSAGPTTMDLPVRVRTTLAVGRVRHLHRRHGAHAVLVRSTTAQFGQRVGLRGLLSLPGPNPLAFADVEVSQQTALPNQPWRRVGVVRTDSRGGFAYTTTRGPSRTIGFTYGGTPLLQPRSSYVRLRVRASTSFHVNRHHVVNGDDVVFGGRVRGHLPRTGKLVQLQAYSRGTWRTFATPRAGAHSHRWRYVYRFSATRGLVRYRFRAVLPREAGFPYARGTSRHIHVTVRGL